MIKMYFNEVVGSKPIFIKPYKTNAEERIFSDKWAYFEAKECEEYCSFSEIRHTLTSTQHSQGNEILNSANRTLLTTIETSMENPPHKHWNKKMEECERNVNNN